ncbi:hypothetical protein Trydic_g13739 [Trypoxylus dichotomus]
MTPRSTADMLNITDGEADEYTPYNERPETYIVPVLFFIIFVVGVLGNGTLVIIFLRHKPMRNVPNTYILSLSLADLLLILTCVPFTSIIYTVESWPWGVVMCKTSEIAKDISTGVSVFTLTALSAERYSAIVNPLRKLQHPQFNPVKYDFLLNKLEFYGVSEEPLLLTILPHTQSTGDWEKLCFIRATAYRFWGATEL